MDMGTGKSVCAFVGDAHSVYWAAAILVIFIFKFVIVFSR